MRRVKIRHMEPIFDAMCGPGPVNLGDELTVRHSALCAVNAHLCCYKFRWQLLRTTDISDKALLLSFYCCISMHPLQCNVPTHPSFNLWIVWLSWIWHSIPLSQQNTVKYTSPCWSGDLVLVTVQSSHLFSKNIHTSYNRQNLAFVI